MQLVGIICLFMFSIGVVYMAINKKTTKIEQAFFIESVILMNIAIVLLLIRNN